MPIYEYECTVCKNREEYLELNTYYRGISVLVFCSPAVITRLCTKCGRLTRRIISAPARIIIRGGY
mgnify:FL=1